MEKYETGAVDHDDPLVVIGASAGGLEAISGIIRDLPNDFPAPIVFLSHLSRERKSNLTHILSRRTAMEVCEIEDDMPLIAGRLHVSIPGKKVNIERGKLTLSDCSHADKFCPSIDAAFTSAAKAYGDNLILVLLSGLLDDGIKGLQANHEYGGLTLVQHPDEAQFSSMPLEAIRRDHPDSILSLVEIAKRLKALTSLAR